MNYDKAREVLEFASNELITIDILKKRYRRLALLYHPDKNNNSEESKFVFQQIQEAYSLLSSRLEKDGNYSEDVTEEHANTTTGAYYEYNVFLSLFMESFLQSENTLFRDIVKELVLNGCKKLSVSLFEKIDKDVAVEILSFIMKHRCILHIDEDMIERVKEVIMKKFENVQLYILNPTLEDMFSHTLYKLSVNNYTYFVPLWHSEMYFDGEEGDILVKCIPDLPDNVFIDDERIIHVELKIAFIPEYLDDNSVSFELGGQTFCITNLLMKRTHIYHLPKVGLSVINENNVYAVDEKMGMYVKLTFTAE